MLKKKGNISSTSHLVMAYGEIESIFLQHKTNKTKIISFENA